MGPACRKRPRGCRCFERPTGAPGTWACCVIVSPTARPPRFRRPAPSTVVCAVYGSIASARAWATVPARDAGWPTRWAGGVVPWLRNPRPYAPTQCPGTDDAHLVRDKTDWLLLGHRAVTSSRGYTRSSTGLSPRGGLLLVGLQSLDDALDHEEDRALLDAPGPREGCTLGAVSGERRRPGGRCDLGRSGRLRGAGGLVARTGRGGGVEARRAARCAGGAGLPGSSRARPSASTTAPRPSAKVDSRTAMMEPAVHSPQAARRVGAAGGCVGVAHGGGALGLGGVWYALPELCYRPIPYLLGPLAAVMATPQGHRAPRPHRRG